jgi:hypothetical protein
MNTITTSKISGLLSVACLGLALAGCGAVEDDAFQEQGESNLGEADQALLDFCTHVTGDAKLGPSTWTGQALCLKHEYLHAKAATHSAWMRFISASCSGRVMRVIAERQFLGVWTKLWTKEMPMIPQAGFNCSASYTSPVVVNNALTTGTKLRFTVAAYPPPPDALANIGSIVTPQ